MKSQNTFIWARVLILLASLIGIFYAMSYFKSGKAFQDPNSPAGILIAPPPPPTEPAAPAPQNR